mgnify:CR=1 FL=1
MPVLRGGIRMERRAEAEAVQAEAVQAEEYLLKRFEAEDQRSFLLGRWVESYTRSCSHRHVGVPRSLPDGPNDVRC